jgi:hypothetical protein
MSPTYVFYSFLGPRLLAILLLVGLVAGIVMLVRHRGEAGEDPGIGTVRRLYLYGLAFAGLLAAGIGGVLLLKTALDALFGPRAIAVGNTPLALGLALTVVGTPVWLLFWSLAQRSLSRQVGTVEARAVSRQVYLYLVLGGSAVTSSTGAIMFLRWAFGVGEFSGTPAALAVVWSGVWAFHWLVQDREAQPSDLALSIRRVYVYLLTFFGLVLLAIGIGVVVRMALGGAYHELFGGPALLAGSFSIWNRATQTGLAMALVGLGVWWWHWHRLARRDFESSLRQIYLYLFAVLAGAATVVVSLSVLLYHLLQWFIGRPETSSPLLHFDVVPGLIAAGVVGSGMWGYHRAVVREEVRVPIPGTTRGPPWHRPLPPPPVRPPSQPPPPPPHPLPPSRPESRPPRRQRGSHRGSAALCVFPHWSSGWPRSTRCRWRRSSASPGRVTEAV